MKNKKSCSIIIRTHNNAEYLERLLKKISIQKKVNDPEVIIIDSSSTDNTEYISKQYGCKIIRINPSEFTHAHTFNLGAENAKSELIAYVSVDIIPKSTTWLYSLLKEFKDCEVAGVFGKQEPINGFNPIEEFKMIKMFPKKGISPANFSNANGIIRKSVWKKIKYDEHVPYQYIGGEDQTLAVKAKELGYKIVYVPEASVYHSHRYSLKSRLSGAYMIGLNSKKIKKWNKKVFILSISKQDLIFYLIKKREFKSLLYDLILVGVLLRIWRVLGLVSGYFQRRKDSHKKIHSTSLFIFLI